MNIIWTGRYNEIPFNSAASHIESNGRTISNPNKVFQKNKKKTLDFLFSNQDYREK